VGWVVMPLKISSGALMGANNLGILSGNRSVQGSVGGADSSNLYRFEMPKTGQFDLSVTNMIANANVQLIDSQGNVIDKSGNSENQTESISRTLTAGTYYIQIYTTRKNADRTYVSTDYTLNLSSPVVYIPPPGDGLGDTLSTARNLGTLGTEERISNSVGNDDPSDYYRFNLSDRKRFRSVLFPLGTDEKANFELLDSNGNIIAKSSTQNGVGNLNEILDKGTYYFHVYQANKTKANYNLFLHGLPAPTSSVSAQVPSNHWKAEYFNNRDLAGNPVHVEDFGDGSQNFEHQWGLGSPTNTPSDNFSARITTQRYFPEGKYQIKVNADDGVRVRIGNQLVIEKWQDQGFDNLRTGYFHSNGGQYPVTVEYYEKGGAAALKFDIESFNSFEEPASNGSEWNSSFFWWDKGQGNEPPVNFYENQDNFIGVVSLGSNQRSDGQNGIHLNLGDRFPQGDSRLPHDFFALRSYTHADFEKGKRYRILVKADDGFQLLAKHHWLPDNDPNKWVDITSKYHWQQAYDSYKVIDFEVPNSGKYDLHFHLYEAGGDAYMDLAWGEIVGNFMVSGDFYNAYKNRRELGNPTSEVFDSGNGTFKQNFDHGYIFWNGQSAQVYQTGSGKPSQPSNSFQTGRVNSQVGSLPLRLRNEPSTIGTTTLDLLYQGTTFKIIRQVSSSDPNWHSWYEVEANGKHGYVAADYVDIIDAVTITDGNGSGVHDLQNNYPTLIRTGGGYDTDIWSEHSDGNKNDGNGELYRILFDKEIAPPNRISGGWRADYRAVPGAHGYHTGIDYQMVSDFPFYSISDGELIPSYQQWKRYGTISIYNPKADVTFHYLHTNLDSWQGYNDDGTVKNNQPITKGTFLGKVGATGTGAQHLHIEVVPGKDELAKSNGSTPEETAQKSIHPWAAYQMILAMNKLEEAIQEARNILNNIKDKIPAMLHFFKPLIKWFIRDSVNDALAQVELKKTEIENANKFIEEVTKNLANTNQPQSVQKAKDILNEIKIIEEELLTYL